MVPPVTSEGTHFPFLVASDAKATSIPLSSISFEKQIWKQWSFWKLLAMEWRMEAWPDSLLRRRKTLANPAVPHGALSGADSSKDNSKSPAIPFPSEFLPLPSAPTRQSKQRINVPVHQAGWHWQHHVPLPYPDVTLSHDWHLDPERIPVPAVPRSARAHAEEVWRRRVLLTQEQRRGPAYAIDSPN
ncbi:Cytochrome P450 71C4 [Hordeum vulgare]|nr:Cytochrome P450 71C4 [Hordeum vulgare]